MHFPTKYLVFTVDMRNGALTVDEGVEDGTEEICLTLDITGGGSVRCPLTVTLDTTAGTASMPSLFTVP